MTDTRDNTDSTRIDLSIGWQIYAIHERGNPDNVWYVGQSKNISSRISNHKSNINTRPDYPLYAHLATHDWDYTILEEVWSKSEARSAERRWIASYLNRGTELFNKSSIRPMTPKDEAKADLQKRATDKGITLIEGALIVVTPEGLLNVLEWDGEKWEATHASRVVPL